jgi:hypothetical protein
MPARFACSYRRARQPEFFLAALDQEGLELPLQGTDLLAHRGLGDVVDLGRLGETFRLCQITKNF